MVIVPKLIEADMLLKQGKKGIWLKILSEQADLIPIAIQVTSEYLQCLEMQHFCTLFFFGTVTSSGFAHYFYAKLMDFSGGL